MSAPLMLLDNPIRPLRDPVAARDFRERAFYPRSWRSLRWIPVFALFFAVAVILQVQSGAYHSEFAGYPDEPAHYVTSLMVHDYIVQLKLASPMEFARNYYAHYPKVAFGHWPPLLYAVQAAWMLLFSTGRASVLLELAFLTAVLAVSVWYLAERRFGWSAGILAGLLLTCLPIIQIYTDEVMAETLLILTSLWAAVFFARYMESERWQDSCWFGVFSSLAILTKGNGWEIGLAPPVALLLTRRWRLLTRPSFWLPVAIVMVLCLPWQILTLEWAHQGWGGGDKPNWAFASQAMIQFVWILGDFMGPVLSAVALLGVAVTVVIPLFRRSVEPEWAVMTGLVSGVWLFHILVPAGVEARKMIVAVPALILFLFAGGAWLARKTHVPPAILTGALAAAFLLGTFKIPRESHYGFTEAAEFIVSAPQLQKAVVLVSSESDGEGLLISEIAMHEQRPTHTILRASKVLSESNWIDTAYRCFYGTPSEVIDYLHREKVKVVVIDNFPGRFSRKHQELIRQAIRTNPQQWALLKTFPAATHQGEVEVYRFDPANTRPY